MMNAIRRLFYLIFVAVATICWIGVIVFATSGMFIAAILLLAPTAVASWLVFEFFLHVFEKSVFMNE